MRQVLTVVLILSILLNLYLIARKISWSTPSWSYLDNYQYKEQTSIFGAYNSSCTIAFIGDSHIYKCHWSELLGMVVCNRGIGSDIAEGVYSRVGEIHAKVCFIAVGSNDIDLKIPVDTTLKYMRLTVEALKRKGIRPVIMEITNVSPTYTNKAFNDSAYVLNQYFKPICETVRIETDARDIQPDGIHLTAMGYNKWRVAINEFLK